MGREEEVNLRRLQLRMPLIFGTSLYQGSNGYLARLEPPLVVHYFGLADPVLLLYFPLRGVTRGRERGQEWN